MGRGLKSIQKTEHIRRLLALLCACALFLSLPVRAADDARPVRIAFIDSGISTKHIDPARVEAGKNYVFPEADTQDRIGHGTGTASMVLGSEEQGLTGTFPNAILVPLVVVDVYPSGVVKNGGTDALCAAIRDAVDEFDCQIINISLATADNSERLREAVAYAEAHGVVLIASVGNDGAGGRTYYPAAYDTVLSVGSVNGTGAAAFSQSGADILADGVALAAATNRNGASAAMVSGTSYSCAIVSGLCAKLLSAYPDLSPAEARSALLLLASGSVGGCPVIRADVTIPVPFLDVSADSWSYEGILYVFEHGVMNGVGGGRFAPSADTSRAQVVQILFNLDGAKASGGTAGFSDVSNGDWYAASVAWAVENGIVQGRGGSFGANDSVTREQLAVMLYRYARYKGNDTGVRGDMSVFADSGDVSAWADEALAWAVGAGLISGTTGSGGEVVLNARGSASRAQVAAIMERFCTGRN